MANHEFPQKPPTEKIKLPRKRGWLKPFGKVPWKIHYFVVGPKDDNDIVNAADPARQMLTSNTSGGYSLSLYLHYSIPENYKHIVAYHELKEAEITYQEKIDPGQAHYKAAPFTDDYARQYLTSEEFQKFKAWEKNLLDNFKKSS